MNYLDEISKELKRLKREEKQKLQKEELEKEMRESIPQFLDLIRTKIAVELKIDKITLSPKEDTESKNLWVYNIKGFEVTINADDVIARWDEFWDSDESDEVDVEDLSDSVLSIIGSMIADSLRSRSAL